MFGESQTEARGPSEEHLTYSSSHEIAVAAEEEASCASAQQQQPNSPSAAGDSPADAGATQARPPAWVQGMLSSQFFGPCEAHKHLKKNECTHFCTTCTRCSGLCQHCLGSHQGHTVMQIRRYVYCDVVRNHDISPFISTDGIQSYIINQSKVVFLNARPQSKLGSPADTDTCTHCRRMLREGFKFCCLACKVGAEANSQGSSAAAPLAPAAAPRLALSRQPSATSSKRDRTAARRHSELPSPSETQVKPAQVPVQQQLGQGQQLGLGQGQQVGPRPALSGAADEEGSEVKGSGSNQSSSSVEEEVKAKQGEAREGRAAGGSGRRREQERRAGEAMQAAEGSSVRGDTEAQAGCKRRRSSTTRSGRSVRPSSWVKGAAWADEGTGLTSPSGPAPTPQLWLSAGLEAAAVGRQPKRAARGAGGDESKPSVLAQVSMVPAELSNSNSSDLDESGSFFFQAERDGGVQPTGREGQGASAAVGVLPLLVQVQESLRRSVAGAGRRKQGAPQRSRDA